MTHLSAEGEAPLSSKKAELAAEELAVKRLELEARRAEARQKLAAANSSWLQLSSPAVIAALVTAAVGLTGAFLTAHSSLDVEKEKNKGALILQAISTNNPETAFKNIQFLAKAKFFGNQSQAILDAIPDNPKNSPVLPFTNSHQAGFTCSERPVGAPCAGGQGVCDPAGMCVPSPSLDKLAAPKK